MRVLQPGGTLVFTLALLTATALAAEPPSTPPPTPQITLVAPTIRVLYTNDDFVDAAGKKRSGRAFPRLRDAPSPRDLDHLLRFVPGATGLDRVEGFHGAPSHEVHLHLDGAEVLVPPGWQGAG